jgi:tryptophan synthase beta chain
MLEKNVDFAVYTKVTPTKEGYFGKYGGAYIPPQLVAEFEKISTAYQAISKSSKFINELRRIRKEYQGRPTPVCHCERLSNSIGNCQIYLKREDLNHTGAHKLNHCMGEVTAAQYLGKKKSSRKPRGPTRCGIGYGCRVFRTGM